jgi:putative membrane protein
VSAANVPAKPNPDDATRLAVERTRVAYERTMLAWVRTATALITFGFGVSKFSDVVHSGGEPSHFILGSRDFGLIMVCVGILSLVLAVFENHHNIKSLGKQYAGRQRSTAVAVAGLVAGLGVAALLAMLKHA